MPRSEFGLNFPGIAPDGRKERKTLAILGFNGTDVAGYRPEVRNKLRESHFANQKSRSVLHNSTLVLQLVRVHSFAYLVRLAIPVYQRKQGITSFHR
jgi:hypothetical protein